MDGRTREEIVCSLLRNPIFHNPLLETLYNTVYPHTHEGDRYSFTFLSTFHPGSLDMVIYKSTLPSVPLPDLDLYTFHFEPNKYNRFFSHDTPLFIDGHSGRSLTYSQVYDLSSRMARGWRDKVGLKKGDVVACFAPNQYDHIVLYMSLLGAQATITPG